MLTHPYKNLQAGIIEMITSLLDIKVVLVIFIVSFSCIVPNVYGDSLPFLRVVDAKGSPVKGAVFSVIKMGWGAPPHHQSVDVAQTDSNGKAWITSSGVISKDGYQCCSLGISKSSSDYYEVGIECYGLDLPKSHAEFYVYKNTKKGIQVILPGAGDYKAPDYSAIYNAYAEEITPTTRLSDTFAQSHGLGAPQLLDLLKDADRFIYFKEDKETNSTNFRPIDSIPDIIKSFVSNEGKSLEVDLSYLTIPGAVFETLVKELPDFTSLNLFRTNIGDDELSLVRKYRQNLTRLNLGYTNVSDAAILQLLELKQLKHLELEHTKTTWKTGRLLNQMIDGKYRIENESNIGPLLTINSTDGRFIREAEQKRTLTGSLELSSQDLNDQKLVELGELKSIHHIDVGENTPEVLTGPRLILPSVVFPFKQFPNARGFYIRTKNIGAHFFKEIGEAQFLEKLALFLTEVDDQSLQGLRTLNNLKFIMLTDTPVSDDVLGFVSEHPIEQLYLGNTKVTVKGLLKFPGKHLRTLDVSGLPITNEILLKLIDFPKLEDIWVKNTFVTREGITEAQKRRPKLKISCKFLDHENHFSDNVC